MSRYEQPNQNETLHETGRGSMSSISTGEPTYNSVYFNRLESSNTSDSATNHANLPELPSLPLNVYSRGRSSSVTSMHSDVDNVPPPYARHLHSDSLDSNYIPVQTTHHNNSSELSLNGDEVRQQLLGRHSNDRSVPKSHRTVSLAIPTDSTKICKFCHEGQVDPSDTLISPCLCDGSLAYVHLSCLQNWRIADTRKDSFTKCEICGYKYRLSRPRLASIVGSSLFLNAFTISLLSLSLLLIMVVCASLDSRIAHRPFSFNLLCFAIALSILSLLGWIWLIARSCCLRSSSTSRPPAIGFGMPGFYGIGTCDCAGMGLGGGDGLAILLLTFLFLIAAFGILLVTYAAYVMVRDASDKYLSRVKERILEVKKH